MNCQVPLRVLVVEDDVDTLRNLVDILEIDQHLVFTARSAAEALALPELPIIDVVLLDRRLPDALAEDLLPQLRLVAADADVVLVTGHADTGSAIAALRLGAADYLLKPTNADLLRVSLRRLAERRSAEERALALGRFLEDSLNEIYIFDAANSRFLLVNRGARENLGYTMEQLRDMTPAELQGEGAGPPLLDLLERLRTGKQQRLTLETQLRRQDGSTYPTELHVQLGRFDYKPVFVVIGLDLSERKRAEERLVQHERLAALGDAMTCLAHESRNALQRSQACLEMLARRVEDRPEALQLVNRIQVAQDDLHRLYEDVRAYAAPLKIRRQELDLDELTHAAWEDLLLKRHGRQAELFVQGTDIARHCCLDRFALRQVFRNVFDNALAACPDPVRIDVRFSHLVIDQGPGVRVAVSDNGPGFTAEQRQRMFDAFFTTKTHGTGLGLAICKRIVEAHGGNIYPGNGAGGTVIIDLPRRTHEAVLTS